MLKFCLLFAFVAITSATLMSVFHDEEDSRQIPAVKITCPVYCLKNMTEGQSNCSQDLKRWFYNKESMKCESFKYTGCGGSQNRFESKKACKERCKECSNKEAVNRLDLPSCDCNYRRPHGVLSFGGCRITHGAPEGYKCHCKLNAWRFSCNGESIQCSKQEVCPANCTSWKCCKNGEGSNGNCNGYSKPLPTKLGTNRPNVASIIEQRLIEHKTDKLEEQLGKIVEKVLSNYNISSPL